MTAPVCPWLAEPCISGTLATLACEVPARLTLLSKVVRFPNLPTSLPTNQPTYQPKPGRLTLPVKSFHRPLSTTTYKLLTHTLQTKLSTYHNSLWTTLTLPPHRRCVVLQATLRAAFSSFTAIPTPTVCFGNSSPSLLF